MKWEALTPSGTHVTPETLAEVDPYLAWADASEFQNFHRRRDGKRDLVRVLVELCAGVRPAELDAQIAGTVASAYLGADTRYCTAEFTADDCRRFARPGNRVVERFEFIMPILPQRPRQCPHACRQQPLSEYERPKSDSTTLMVVIDHGCPFAHANFRHENSTRVLNLWDQDRTPAFGISPAEGRVPPDFEYGREVNRSMLDQLCDESRVGDGGPIDEDACYEAARYPELRRRVTHGAHVMDQLVGPRRLADRIALDPGGAPTFRRRARRKSDKADVVFVQLPRDTWADPAGNALVGCILDGLRYALSCAGPGTKTVVANISCALYTGPHNGSSIFDKAIEELVSNQRHLELRVYMPSGNSFQASWHAAADLDRDAKGFVKLRVSPGSEAPTFVQVWSTFESHAPDIAVAAPALPMSEPIVAGEGRVLRSDEGNVVACAINTLSRARGHHPASDGRRESLVLLAIEPTRTLERPGCNAPSGVWTIEIRATETTAVRVYAARNESELGEPLRGRPSRLLDPSYNPERYLRNLLDDDTQISQRITALDPPTVIGVRRRGTISGVATGPGVVAVAGYRLRPVRVPADYSSAGEPDPTAAAASEESPALCGIPGAGTRSGCVVRLCGTSFASPQRARYDLDRVWFEKLAAEPGSRQGNYPKPSRKGRWGKKENYFP